MKNKVLHLLLLLLTLSYSLVAQPDLSPWNENPYGNEWIDYSKKYVRVGILQDGMYQIPLATLSARVPGLNSTNVQAWFRGKQIALKIDGTNVIFYGRKNDGASDGLMFRPGPEARLDYTTNFFSEEGAHFFTAGGNGEPVLRMAVNNASPSGGEIAAEPYHIETLIKNNSDWLTSGTYAGRRFDQRPFAQRAVIDGLNSLNNSFYEQHNAFIKLLETSQSWLENINLTNFVVTSEQKTSVEFALHGDGPGGRNVDVHLAPEESQLSDADKRIHSATLSGLAGVRVSYLLEEGTHISSSGKAFLKFSSTSPSVTSANSRNRFGVSYYRIDYPQSLSFEGSTSKKFHFKAKEATQSRILLTGVPANAKVYDISDRNAPRELNGLHSETTLTLDITRNPGQPLVLQVITPAGVTTPLDANIYDVPFDLLYSSVTGNPVANIKPSPSDFDYLVITHKATGAKQVKEAAVEFAKYRVSPDGGGYKTLVISTRTIYDQFNFGEPSPIAIGRFVNYMIQDGVRSTHNVLLVGHGVGRVDNIIREIPSDIPTFGEPGSDVLLVSGLSNSPHSSIDVPAIPIGRISAFTNQQVLDYRDKVIEYERQTRELPSDQLKWRKGLLNLIGSKLASEPTSFHGYVADAVARMDASLGPWAVTELSSINAPGWPPASGTELARVNAPIEGYINDGVGMLTYYGHGNFSGTVYDIGSASQSRYTQTNKRYPFVYITGCGVGDAFSSHGVLYIASDWIYTPNKGAIAMFANTYLAYTGTAANYMTLLYEQIFGQSDANRRTLGGIQVNMAKLVTGSSNARVAATDNEIANVHQTALFGDPALRILLVSDSPLPVSYLNFSGTLQENSSVRLAWETASERNNDHFVIERSRDGKTFDPIGKVLSKRVSTDERTPYSFVDASPITGINYYRLKQVDVSPTEESSGSSAYSTIISVSVKSGITQKVSIYPNPTRDKVIIDGEGVSKWRLLNSSGSVALEGVTPSADLSGLTSGIFILEITTSNDEVIRKKIVKDR
jgi:hypothetical protein